MSTSNRFPDAGFRDDRDSGDAPLLALGDSFTGCFGVESDECWGTLLARDLGVEFANLGMWAGGGIEQVRLAFSAIKHALMDRNLVKGLSASRDSKMVFNVQGSRGSEE